MISNIDFIKQLKPLMYVNDIPRYMVHETLFTMYLQQYTVYKVVAWQDDKVPVIVEEVLQSDFYFSGQINISLSHDGSMLFSSLNDIKQHGEMLEQLYLYNARGIR